MEQQQQKPSVGRIVHYVSRGSADGMFESTCRAAIITEVSDNMYVGLCVINPTGLFYHSLGNNDGCHYHEGTDEGKYYPGTWHWPERI